MLPNNGGAFYGWRFTVIVRPDINPAVVGLAFALLALRTRPIPPMHLSELLSAPIPRLCRFPFRALEIPRLCCSALAAPTLRGRAYVKPAHRTRHLRLGLPAPLGGNRGLCAVLLGEDFQSPLKGVPSELLNQ
jgi:hypothetical protein